MKEALESLIYMHLIGEATLPRNALPFRERVINLILDVLGRF